MCTTSVQVTKKGRKHHSLELEAQMVVSTSVDAEDQTWVLCKSNKYSELPGPCSSPILFSSKSLIAFYSLSVCAGAPQCIWKAEDNFRRSLFSPATQGSNSGQQGWQQAAAGGGDTCCMQVCMHV